MTSRSQKTGSGTSSRPETRLPWKLLLIAFTLAVMTVVSLRVMKQWWQVSNTERDTAYIQNIGGEFSLISHAGPISLSDFRGKVVPIFFGYTYCPDVCPMSLVTISTALQRLQDTERESVQVLFISVDPERDTPKRLAEYTAAFHPEILGLTGSQEAIATVAEDYKVFYKKVDASNASQGYEVDHSASFYIVGVDGKMHALLSNSSEPEKFVEEIRRALTH